MAGFELAQRFIQSQRLEQIMAPQQIQALEILLSTLPELEQKINEELAENPTLELIESGRESLAGNPVEGGGNGDGIAESEAAAAAAEKDEALATLIQLTENWQDYSAGTQYSSGPSEDDEERRQYLFDSLTVEPGLQDVLEEQLREIHDLNPEMAEICMQIIGSIDETGYLRTHPSDLAIVTGADPADIRRGIAIIQSFEPAGIGARDLRECLLLQLQRKGEKGSLAYRLVDEFLEEAGRNQIPKIARALRISNSHVYELLEDIRQLNPYPGSLVAGGGAEYVYPEVYIEKDEEGEWVVRPNREYRPRLRLSPHYMKLLSDPSTPKDVKSYIREKVTSSRQLLKAIDQRQSTIERIATSLLEYQRDFFENGVEHMRPLTMSQVADDIEVHETTVSRAIANKYVQTPHGLFRFKHFFSTGYRASDGDEVSSLGIKEKIKHLIDNEEVRKPLSDQKLVKLLKEQGFKVARRTVAKYREELGIPASHIRRNH